MRKKSLDTRTELDFHYLLELMAPLHSVDEYAWLPELFSIIGHEKLILLAKFAGGETIQIPTLQELSDSIEALQWFYNIRIKKSARVKDIAEASDEVKALYLKIQEIYKDVGNN